MTDPATRTLIVGIARVAFAARYGDPEASPPGACLYWAECAIEAARACGVRLVLQAGTAMFRRVPPALDDGASSTHFSYVWDRATVHYTAGDEHTARPILPVRPSPHDDVPRVCLPEMHVWAGDPVAQHVVDLSTFALRHQCANVLGEPWLDVDPPAFVWESPRVLDTERGWLYQPDRYATLLAAQLLREQRLRESV